VPNKNLSLQFRNATRSDSKLVLKMLQESAAEQKLQNEFLTTEFDLLRDLFGDNPRANVLIIEKDKEIVGITIFFFNFASFIGCSGIYIEDIYVRPKFQSQGFGRQILSYMADYALKNNCGLLEWLVLDENKRAQDFYKKMGAYAEDGWTVHRAKKATLKKWQIFIIKLKRFLWQK